MDEDKIIKISIDKEKAKSIQNMAIIIIKRIDLTDKKKFASLIISDYYEVIKELITAILACKGLKTLSHKILIEQSKEFKEINKEEYYLIDELRVIRNKINYDGFFVECDYLERKEKPIKETINKLLNILENNLK
jgi:hypothetical protein